MTSPFSNVNMKSVQQMQSHLSRFQMSVFMSRLINAISLVSVMTLTCLCLIFFVDLIWETVWAKTLIWFFLFGAVATLLCILGTGSYSSLFCAMRVDREYHLQNRIGTAVDILMRSQRFDLVPMMAAQVDDAIAVAESISVRGLLQRWTQGVWRRLTASVILALFAGLLFILMGRGQVKGESLEREAIWTTKAVILNNVQALLDRQSIVQLPSETVKALEDLQQSVQGPHIHREEIEEALNTFATDIRMQTDAGILKQSEAMEITRLRDVLQRANSGGGALGGVSGIKHRQQMDSYTMEKMRRLRAVYAEGAQSQVHASDRSDDGWHDLVSLEEREEPRYVGSGLSRERIESEFQKQQWPLQYRRAIRAYYSVEDK